MLDRFRDFIQLAIMSDIGSESPRSKPAWIKAPLEIQFVSRDGKVTGTRVFEFPWCPPAWQSPASHWRGNGHGNTRR